MTKEKLLKEISNSPRKQRIDEHLGIIMMLVDLHESKLIVIKDGYWYATETGKIKANGVR